MKDPYLGEVRVRTMPTPEGLHEMYGTYTFSGRVLVSGLNEKEEYVVLTMNDDGADIVKVYEGPIPQSPTANGIRWMCYTDNRRVLLGDYVLEATPDLDHVESCAIMPVRFPEEIMHFPGLFRHWSEPIIAPDGEHMVWTMLVMTGAHNFLGNLVRHETEYVLENVRCISSVHECIPDPEHPGFGIPQVVRGGEAKQFVMGGRAIALAGNSDSINDSVVEELDTGLTHQFSHTPGYEETAIFSPDEKKALCMTTRFSPGTDCAILGQIPLPHSNYVRIPLINAAYNYTIGSKRQFRKGNIGPALVSAEETWKQGRAYTGVNVSDPEDLFVYYSPMSWAPCSTKAMWCEKTRRAVGPVEERLQIVELLDQKPTVPVPYVKTPSADQVPYAITIPELLEEIAEVDPVYNIKGAFSGEIRRSVTEDGFREQIYDNYSEDGKTFYNGRILSKGPASIFAAGEYIFAGDLMVTGEHSGELKAAIVLTQNSIADPANPDLARCHGHATYDGVTVRAEGMNA